MHIFGLRFGGPVCVKVPLTEPGLVQVRRDADGKLNEDDLAKLRAVYGILKPVPQRVLRIQESRL